MAFMLPPRPPRSARQPRPAAAPPAVDPTPALTARLEFLLSDSNLHKDAHLRELLEAHRGYVPLAAVAAFPRVAAVPGVSVAALAAAVLTSPLLALSPDGATVCRRVPYVHAPADAYDDRTVYVEGFPAASATHDSLTAFFSRWGAVTHVSLPKWRGQGKRRPKGFAFVEFMYASSAHAAVRAHGGSVTPQAAADAARDDARRAAVAAAVGGAASYFPPEWVSASSASAISGIGFGVGMGAVDAFADVDADRWRPPQDDPVASGTAFMAGGVGGDGMFVDGGDGEGRGRGYTFDEDDDDDDGGGGGEDDDDGGGDDDDYVAEYSPGDDGGGGGHRRKRRRRRLRAYSPSAGTHVSGYNNSHQPGNGGSGSNGDDAASAVAADRRYGEEDESAAATHGRDSFGRDLRQREYSPSAPQGRFDGDGDDAAAAAAAVAAAGSRSTSSGSRGSDGGRRHAYSPSRSAPRQSHLGGGGGGGEEVDERFIDADVGVGASAGDDDAAAGGGLTQPAAASAADTSAITDASAADEEEADGDDEDGGRGRRRYIDYLDEGDLLFSAAAAAGAAPAGLAAAAAAGGQPGIEPASAAAPGIDVAAAAAPRPAKRRRESFDERFVDDSDSESEGQPQLGGGGLPSASPPVVAADVADAALISPPQVESPGRKRARLSRRESGGGAVAGAPLAAVAVAAPAPAPQQALAATAPAVPELAVPPAPAQQPQLTVMMKSQWLALKAAGKAALAAAKRAELVAAGVTVGLPPLPAPPGSDDAARAAAGGGGDRRRGGASSSSSTAATGANGGGAPPPYQRGVLVRLAGVPLSLSFRHLRDLAQVPGRPRYVDCPPLYANGVVDGRPLSAAARAGLVPETGFPAAAAAAPAASPTAAAATTTAVIRYFTPAEAAAAVAHFQRSPPVLPGAGTAALTASAVTGADEDAYWKGVHDAQDAYQRAKAKAAGAASR